MSNLDTIETLVAAERALKGTASATDLAGRLVEFLACASEFTERELMFNAAAPTVATAGIITCVSGGGRGQIAISVVDHLSVAAASRE